LPHKVSASLELAAGERRLDPRHERLRIFAARLADGANLHETGKPAEQTLRRRCGASGRQLAGER